MTIQVFEGEGVEPPVAQRWTAENILVAVPSPFNTDEGRIFLTNILSETRNKIDALEIGAEIDVSFVGEYRGFGDDESEEFDPKITVLFRETSENKEGLHAKIFWVRTEAARKAGLEVGPDYKLPDGL